ncbi:MAG: hypothetical protein ACFE94_12640 [Candidatus Hodarchaeota archaeon]
MSEVSLREIIGIAKNSKWNQIKKFVKFIVRNTLKKNSKYNLTALDVLINGKKELKYDRIIKTKEEIKEIDKIKDFNQFSLYQTTSTSNNHINISQNNETIIVLAKYLGPYLDDPQIFDFSVNLDAINDPFFTIGNGKKINCSEILEIFNKKAKPVSAQQKEPPKERAKKVEDFKTEDLELMVFEKLTNKNAIWNETETKAFHNWKAKIKNKYRLETGKITHYKGKPTKLFALHLHSLLKNKDVKEKKPTKPKDKKPLKPKEDIEKITEQYIFEKVTGKKAIWNGSETQNFVKWKQRAHKNYKKSTEKNPYYRQKLTNNYRNYLQRAFKITSSNKER